MLSRKLRLLATLATALAVQTSGAFAMEKVKVATTFLGLWDTSQPQFCKDRGEFEKAGLDVEISNTRGGSENVQSVVAGGMDIGYSPGVNSVLAGYVQGAGIRIVSAQFTGQAGAFFYVLADSPIKSVDDLNGKTVAFSRPGGAMEGLVLAFKEERNLDLKPVATGAMNATHTMVMTGQIDVGYSVVPALLDAVNKGEIRILFESSEVESRSNLTDRVNIASIDFLEKRRDVATKFFEVLDGCIDWAYANIDETAKMYADLNKIDLELAKQAVKFYSRDKLNFGPVKGFDESMELAVRDGFLKEPLPQAKVDELMDIIYETKPQ
ncbi:MAG: ABC transporter substrate-binding protein [Rhizobiaceae bacterium]|nr:ABC transporter substrate-binding protein [Rhizobiaceae bacterium]